ncbi:Daple-like protein [Trichinella sp. T9]|nr:Daple-like protein [Trichinella sp. T9]
MPATKSCKKDAFFSHALYAWLQTCPKSFNEPMLVNNSTAAVPQISFLELCNGITLNGLMHYIYPDCKKEPLDLNVSGVGARLRNLRLLIQSIQSFYKDVLNQHIIMPLPDMLAIAKSPFPDITGDEMKKVLLLLLGCAVQSDRREEFINQIKSLDNCTQQAIVDEIRKVTSEASCVLNAHMLDEFVNDERLAVLVKQLLIVVHERDQYAQHLLEANQEQQELDGSSALSSCNGGNACSGKLSENQQQATEYPDESVSRHCAVEIADLKAKVRRLRQDLDERNEMLSIYKEEIVEKDTVLAKMRQENFELMKSHRALNDYRDEVDALREKSERCDRLEEDCERMKEKLEELDFYKSRIDELREENHVLLETRNIYEEQLNGFRCRLAQLSEKETEVIKLERRLVDMEQEMEADKRRLEQLYDENIRLEKECRDGQSRSAKLQAELSRLTECGPHKKHEEIGYFSSTNIGSLSSQLSESTIARIHKLELENQRLRQRCDLETVSVASSVEQQSEEKEGILQELRCKNDALCDQLVKLEQKETSLQKQLFELESEKQIMQQRIDELELQINNKNTGADDDDDADGGGGKKKSISSDERRQHEVGEMELLQNELVERNAQIAIFEQELSSAESKLKLAEADLRRLENEQITTQAQFASLQRDRSFLENENAKVKQSLESADAELEQCRQRLGRLEVEHERLATVRLQYDELSAHMDSLQSTNRRLQQQLEVEANKNQALAEDLVNEKRKIHSFEQLITEMRSSLNTSSEEENPVDDEKQRCANEDDPRILFWRVIQRLKNQIASGQQQLECSENELAALRQQIASQCAFAVTDEQRQSSTVLADVTDSVENIRLKNRLLIDENSNIRQQVHILQSQIEKYCNEAQMTSNENLKLRQELREMQIKLVNLLLINIIETVSMPAILDLEKRHLKRKKQVVHVSECLFVGEKWLGSDQVESTLCFESPVIPMIASVLDNQSEKSEFPFYFAFNSSYIYICDQLAFFEMCFTEEEEEMTSLGQMEMGSGRQAEAENAGLQVELRSLQLNHDVIKKENVELQNQCDNWERGAALARRGFEELQKQHRLLLDDHEHLQALHEQLGRDYERLCNDVRQFKVQLKQIRLEKAEQATRLEQLTEENSRLVRLGASERQRDEQQQQRECRLLASLQSEHGQLKKAHDELNGRLEVTSRELETSRAQNRILRAQANAAQLQLAQQQGKCDDVDEARRRVELELAKAEHRCETLTRMNENLEEERRNLLRQLDSLISQQQGLLKQTLLEKDHHHAEEKQLQDQLYKLQSHKEKLEEKIMQQYKTITPNSKRKDRSAFVKRAAKAFLMPRASTRKNNNNKVRESSAEESAMSADESGFFGNFSRTSSSSRKKYCTLPKSAKLASRSPGKTAFSPLLTNRKTLPDSSPSSASDSVQLLSFFDHNQLESEVPQQHTVGVTLNAVVVVFPLSIGIIVPLNVRTVEINTCNADQCVCLCAWVKRIMMGANYACVLQSINSEKYCSSVNAQKLCLEDKTEDEFDCNLGEKIKMHHSRSNSGSTQQSSSLSSDSVVAASLAARQRGWSSRWPGDRVSFSGSERAVDVPNDPMNSQSTVHKGSLPSPATAMQPRTPPPYRCAVQRRDTLAASPLRAVPSLLANGHLGRLPPPYPGKKAAPCTAESSNLLCSRTALEQSVAQLQRDLGLPSSKIPNHSNVQNGANDNNGSDNNNTVTSVADELFSNLSSVSSVFAPPKASTPKSDDNNSSATSSSAMAPLHPGNNSLVSSEPSSNGSVAAQVDTDVTPKRRPLTTTRQAVRSIYDNVPTTSGNDQPNQKSAAQLEDDEDSSIEKTLTELLRDCKTEHENAVWFEYGCV